jgi:lipid-binding SYLF domain-containing protein
MYSVSRESILFIIYPVQSFVDSRNNGLDGVIPRSVLQNAKGFAIFTVAKAGFVFSARAGSGVVIVKLDNGSMFTSKRVYLVVLTSCSKSGPLQVP